MSVRVISCPSAAIVATFASRAESRHSGVSLRVVQRPDDILRGELLTVVEGDALAQRERVGQAVLRDLPVLGERRARCPARACARPGPGRCCRRGSGPAPHPPSRGCRGCPGSSTSRMIADASGSGSRVVVGSGDEPPVQAVSRSAPAASRAVAARAVRRSMGVLSEEHPLLVRMPRAGDSRGSQVGPIVQPRERAKVAQAPATRNATQALTLPRERAQARAEVDGDLLLHIVARRARSTTDAAGTRSCELARRSRP